MRTVIIGAGQMGLRHIDVTRSLGLDLAGICDQKAEAREAAARCGIPARCIYDDAQTMLQEAAPHCVIVATTAPGHAPLTRLAVQKGARYILCEKPLATSLAEADCMLSTCREHGVHLAVNHQMRFMEQYTRARQIVNSACFGGLASITVVAGNFGMAMNGMHYIEMFRYMTDEPPVEAQAWFSSEVVPNPRGPQFEDRGGALRLTTGTGKRFFMDIGTDQGHGVQVTYAGPFGRLTVDELSGDLDLVVRQAEHRDLPTTRYGMPWERTSEKITPAESVGPSRAVLEALLTSRDYPTGEIGRLAMAALVAGYVSNERDHTPIRIDDGLPRGRVFPWA